MISLHVVTTYTPTAKLQNAVKLCTSWESWERMASDIDSFGLVPTLRIDSCQHNPELYDATRYVRRAMTLTGRKFSD